MATYTLQPIRIVEIAPDNQSEGATVTLNAAATFKKGDLALFSAGTAQNLTNASVANIALATEDAVDDSYRAAGPGFASTKPRVSLLDLKGREVIISAGGAAWADATYIGVTRGVKRDAGTGRTYIDVTDAATPAFRIKRRLEEYMRDTTGGWGLPKDGDTNVLVVAEILDTAAAVL